MKTLRYADLELTRNFLQDISRIVGKVQQVFLPADPNYWHMGLEMTNTGLATQLLPDGTRITIDLRKGVVIAGQASWDLAEISAPALLELFQQWLVSKGMDVALARPELSTDKPRYDKKHANKLADAFYFAHDMLVALKQECTEGIVSPILLYPHHFDISLSWFPHRQKASEKDEKQYTFGFSMGDITIPEPYFYTTLYPSSNQFASTALASPAYWQHKGFTGAILKYNDVISLSNPANATATFYKTILLTERDFQGPSSM